MRFTADQEALAAAAAWAVSAAPAKTTQAILTTLQINVGQGQLRFTGTDYETTARATCEAVTDDTGTINVPGKFFAGILAALPARHEVTAELDDSLLRVTCGASRFTVPTMDTRDFPTMPELPGTVGTAVGAEFAEAVAAAARATTRDDTLPILTGVYVEWFPDHVLLVATDRYRLVAVRLPVVRDGDTELAPVLISAATMSGFAKAAGGAGKVAFAYDGLNAIGFGDGTRQMLTRPVAGEYPKWRKNMVAEESVAFTAVVNAEHLTAAVKRCTLAADEAGNPVTLTFSGDTVTVESSGGDGMSGSETIPGVVFDGPDGTARMFRAEYLLDGLAGARSQLVRVGMQPTALKPILFTAASADPDAGPDPDPDYRYTCVPLRKANQ